MFRCVFQFVFTNLQTVAFSLLESDVVTEQVLFFCCRLNTNCFFFYFLFSFVDSHFCDKTSLIEVTSGVVNLSIKMLVPSYEARFSILDGPRRGATGFSRRVSLKAKNVVGGSRLKGVQKSPTEGLVKYFGDFCFKQHLPKCSFSLSNTSLGPLRGAIN